MVHRRNLWEEFTSATYARLLDVAVVCVIDGVFSDDPDGMPPEEPIQVKCESNDPKGRKDSRQIYRAETAEAALEQLEEFEQRPLGSEVPDDSSELAV